MRNRVGAGYVDSSRPAGQPRALGLSIMVIQSALDGSKPSPVRMGYTVCIFVGVACLAHA